jgi:hypothetical protein
VTIIEVDKNARYHQITTRKNSGSAGTLAIEVRPRGAASFEQLTENGSQVTMLLNNDVTYGPFAGALDAIRVTAASFNGTDFDVTVAGW